MQARVSSYEGGLKSIQKVVGYPHNGYTTSISVDISCDAGHYSSIQSIQLVKTIRDFLYNPYQYYEV